MSIITYYIYLSSCQYWASWQLGFSGIASLVGYVRILDFYQWNFFIRRGPGCIHDDLNGDGESLAPDVSGEFRLQS